MIRDPFIMMVPGDFEVQVFYTAVCKDCGSTPLPIPFSDRMERNKWVQAHVGSTHHVVALASEMRFCE